MLQNAINAAIALLYAQVQAGRRRDKNLSRATRAAECLMSVPSLDAILAAQARTPSRQGCTLAVIECHATTRHEAADRAGLVF